MVHIIMVARLSCQLFKILFRSSTAVVQLTVNQLVAGSIPAFGASFRISSANLKHQTCNLKRKNYPVDFAPMVEW